MKHRLKKIGLGGAGIGRAEQFAAAKAGEGRKQGNKLADLLTDSLAILLLLLLLREQVAQTKELTMASPCIALQN